MEKERERERANKSINKQNLQIHSLYYILTIFCMKIVTIINKNIKYKLLNKIKSVWKYYENNINRKKN